MNRKSITAAAVVCLLVISPALRAQMPADFTPGMQNMYSHNQGYLGVDIRDIADEQVSALKLKDSHGAEITTVDHDAPAGKIGLREHDVVLQVNKQVVDNADHFRRIMHDIRAGKTVTLIISRDGQPQTFTVQLANRADVERRAWDQHFVVPGPPPDDDNAPPPPSSGYRGNSFAGGGMGSGFSGGGAMFDAPLIGPHSTYTGAMLEPVGQLADVFGVKPGLGLLVRNIDADSPAATAGLKPGDVITRVNAVDITRPEQWFHAVQKSRGKPLQLTIIRNKQEQTLTLTPADSHHTRGALELPSALGDDFSFDNDIAVNPAELDALFANALDNLDALTTQLSQQLNTLQ